MNFTEAQNEAICCRSGSVLVSAGAGSGKTRVLTERLLEYLDPRQTGLPPQDIDHFLVITFTRAAAGELKARIAEAIAARLRENPANMHLRRQLLLCRNAQIGTIHSFCASILREYAGVLGISPAFRILEEEKSERLRASSLERVMERLYESDSEEFLTLADRVGAGRDDARLAELILKLHAVIQSHARPENWLKEQERILTSRQNDISETPWGQELLQDAATEVSFWADRMEEALRLMQTEEKICRAYEASFSETLNGLQILSRGLADGWDEAVACLPVPFPRITGIRNNPDPELAEKLKATREHCRQAMEKLSVIFAGRSEPLLSDLRDTIPEMRNLLSVVNELETEFQKAKARANALDFSDLEHLSIRLLTEEDGLASETAQEISSRFTEIMVDEYQDVSRVQDQIFRALSREGENLFFVGDLKQSIYRFRLADPGIFIEKNAQYSGNGQGGRVIHLQENFRSQPAVLAAVNAVFERCMSERLGNLDYGQADMLLPAAAQQADEIVPELLLVPGETAENTDLEEEAKLVAREILKLMGSARVTDRNGERNIRFGDIAILLRSANAVGSTFRRVLLAEGVPVSAGAGGDFYGSFEVSVVFSMLSILDNPHRDIPLISLLSSPAFGFSAEKLSLIRAAMPDTDFYSALCASEDEDARSFLGRLQRLRHTAPDLTPCELVDLIAEELDLYALTAAMPDGEQRIQHLMDLSAMAETFQNSGDCGLHRFVNWLRNMEKKSLDPETCTDGGDAVQILSIHRSKGLEFPVVFVCGLGRSFNKQDTRDIVLIHPELGLGPKHTDPERKIEYPTAARRAIERRLNRDMLSEEMRLLYVAMTRAKDRLYLTACVRKADEMLQRASFLQDYTKIPSPFLETASSAVQWLLSTALDGTALQYRICEKEDRQAASYAVSGAETVIPSPELTKLLEKNLTAVYPHERAVRLPSKLTATELKTQDPDAVPLLRQHGRFSQLRKNREHISAARLGTATHLVLQQIDLSKTGTEAEIQNEIKRLKQQHFLTEEEAGAVDAGKILAFFSSGIGRRLLSAEKVWREFRFSLLSDAGDLLPGEEAEEKILLQGIVDCCFLENGELVVVDYKTDRANEEDALRERSEFYRIQIETYARALERIFCIPVKEKILYFLGPGTAVEIT